METKARGGHLQFNTSDPIVTENKLKSLLLHIQSFPNIGKGEGSVSRRGTPGIRNPIGASVTTLVSHNENNKHSHDALCPSHVQTKHLPCFLSFHL
jgi:hypothetical protein